MGRREKKVTKLYITGLRIGNLCHINIHHVYELREKGVTFLPIIKKGPPRHTVKLSRGDSELLRIIEPKLVVLCRGRGKDQPLFIGKGNRSNKGMPIAINYLSKIVNRVLRIASEKIEKYVRTHSFRVTRISDMLEGTDIRTVANIVNHKSAGTTQIYDREYKSFAFVTC